ncbi:MAG: GIY-YIG nuclease family protein [Nitrosopumilaceae archaeon]
MSRKSTTEEFICKSMQFHGSRYDYSKVNYISAISRVCIICPTHGEFFQVAIIHSTGHGCTVCKSEKISKAKKYTTAYYIQKAIQVHGHKYNYSKLIYVNAHKKVCIICSVHGEFWIASFVHLRGSGCKQCFYAQPQQKQIYAGATFTKKCNSVHNNKYSYSLVTYTSNRDKIIIICPKHGKFTQRASDHLNGHGCPLCAKGKSFGVYSNLYFNLNPLEKNKPATLYLFHITTENEGFLKLGITQRRLKCRLNEINYEIKKGSIIIIDYISTTCFKAFKYEQHLLTNLKNYRYIPTFSFGGNTECFTENGKMSIIDFFHSFKLKHTTP